MYTPTSVLIVCAHDAGTAEDVERFSRRTVKVTREHNEECRRLLKLMGIPVVIVRSYHISRVDVPLIPPIGAVRS